MGNHWFGWVAVLYDQVAGIAREANILESDGTLNIQESSIAPLQTKIHFLKGLCGQYLQTLRVNCWLKVFSPFPRSLCDSLIG
jgi:hypothetical protein